MRGPPLGPGLALQGCKGRQSTNTLVSPEEQPAPKVHSHTLTLTAVPDLCTLKAHTKSLKEGHCWEGCCYTPASPICLGPCGSLSGSKHSHPHIAAESCLSPKGRGLECGLCVREPENWSSQDSGHRGASAAQLQDSLQGCAESRTALPLPPPPRPGCLGQSAHRQPRT